MKHSTEQQAIETRKTFVLYTFGFIVYFMTNTIYTELNVIVTLLGWNRSQPVMTFHSVSIRTSR